MSQILYDVPLERYLINVKIELNYTLYNSMSKTVEKRKTKFNKSFKKEPYQERIRDYKKEKRSN